MKAGEAVALVGPNGAGKSTLLKSIFGLIKPSSGSVQFKGEDLRDVPTARLVRKGMSYVPQGSNTFPTLSVEENIRAALAAARRKDISDGLDEAFERFPRLAERRKLDASTLSGGERQMLAVAGALASKPVFLALDEPTTGLAPTIIQGLIESIRAAVGEGIGVAWVVEENPALILPYCDRAYVMKGGRLGPEQIVEDMLKEDLRQLFLGFEAA